MHTTTLRVGPAPTDVITIDLAPEGFTPPTREQLAAHVEYTMRDVLGADADLSPGTKWGAVAAISTDAFAEPWAALATALASSKGGA
ncbi:MAG: hypothetical protein JWM10_2571 [Myxococcaceae bacterium]|nr:hypothetical protein [Myxococcaceae bacterium]